MLGIRACPVRVTTPVGWWPGSGCHWPMRTWSSWGGRCRPNTVRAAVYDLTVFFTAVAKSADQVGPADVLAFTTAQRSGRIDERGGLQP
jgi:hypothetical protein